MCQWVPTRAGTILTVAVVVVAIWTEGGLAAGRDEQSWQGGRASTNIFTPPGATERTVPVYKDAGGDKIRQAIFGRKGDGVGQFNRIRNIPSLTPQQRTQVRDIFTKAKTQFDPIRQQLQELREKYKGDQQAMMADPDVKERLQDLHRQVQLLQAQVNEQVNTILTPQQQQEVEAMRRGELMPSTFNEPHVGIPDSAKQSLNKDRSGAPQQSDDLQWRPKRMPEAHIQAGSDSVPGARMSNPANN